MIYKDGQYPHDYDGLMEMGDLLESIDWDVLNVFDACRWDAFEHVAGTSTPVASPGGATPNWVDEVWCNDRFDWSDVTYISANAVTTAVRNKEQWGGSGGVIEDHVGEYIEAYQRTDIWDAYMRSANSQKLSEFATDFDPPIVVHFIKPHQPYVGDIAVNFRTDIDEAPIDDISSDEQKNSPTFYMAKEGHIDPELIRSAYLDNLRLVWNESQVLREEFDRVITTSDHGELLGPDMWGHGSPRHNQTRVVPFHTTWDLAPTEINQI